MSPVKLSEPVYRVQSGVIWRDVGVWWMMNKLGSWGTGGSEVGEGSTARCTVQWPTSSHRLRRPARESTRSVGAVVVAARCTSPHATARIRRRVGRIRWRAAACHATSSPASCGMFPSSRPPARIRRCSHSRLATSSCKLRRPLCTRSAQFLTPWTDCAVARYAAGGGVGMGHYVCVPRVIGQ